MTFHHAVLDNGLEIVGETLPQARSVAFGFFVRTGSRDETAAENGVSHFLEHMVFKGTERYSAFDVNRQFDDVGAQYNASTSEEITLFYAVVLPEYFATTFPLQADILYPALRDSDFDIEKQVILEEIGMYDDQPGYVAYDAAMRRHFAGHPLGQIILGTTESVTALTADQMRAYHARRYQAGNIVLAVCGQFDWNAVVAEAQRSCGHWPGGSPPRDCPPATPVPSHQWITRSHLTQQQMLRMAPAPSATHRLRYAAELLSVIVGDDSNSRLFWEFVDPGYADAAEISFTDFEGAGAYLTFLSGEPAETAANLERLNRLCEAVNRDGVTDDELQLAKNKVSTRVVLRGERPMGQLSSLGHNWLIRREYRSVEDDLRILNGISQTDIRDLLDQFPLLDITTVGVGPLGG